MIKRLLYGPLPLTTPQSSYTENSNSVNDKKDNPPIKANDKVN